MASLETMPGTAQVRSIRANRHRWNSLIFILGIHLFGEKGAASEPLKESGAARGEIHEDHLVVLFVLLQESQTAFIHSAGVRLRPLLHDATARLLIGLHKVGCRNLDRIFACVSRSFMVRISR